MKTVIDVSINGNTYICAMIKIGEFNVLSIIRERDQGIYLEDDQGNEVLLPKRYIPKNYKIHDHIEVFVYLDNEERLIATTEKPFITKGEFALLRCNQVNAYGAFLDMGLMKELFCPFKEQAFKMREGQWYLVHCYLDESSNRLVASSKTNRFLSNKELTVSKFDEVEVIISHPSQIGMNVIVNKKHQGLIHQTDLFKDVSIGDRLKGVVKKVHANNKLDIVLSQIGYKSIEPNAELVLNELKDNSGYLDLTDKSSPEEIKERLQMSKKGFKKAVGSLYKQRLITIEEDGIYLK